MPPTTTSLHLVADTTYIAMGNMLPMPWVPFDGASPAMYNRAFKSKDLVTAPPIMAYYLPASLNKYHTDAVKHISRKHRIFVHKILSAIGSAWKTWQDMASLVGLIVNGPTCTGAPGCLLGPPLLPLILLEAPKETPQEFKYSKAIAQAFSTAFLTWQETVTIPGMPLWPMFAAFPGPFAPPTPNAVPLMLEGCPAPGQLAMLPPALVGTMLGLLGDPPPKAQWCLQIFTAVSVSLALNFQQWVAESFWKPGSIQGEGPIPTFAPPVAPVGPVVMGMGQAPPGGLFTPGPGGVAKALMKLGEDAVEDVLEGDSAKDITADMIGDAIDVVFAAFGGGKGKGAAKAAQSEAEKAAKKAAKKEAEKAAKAEAEKLAEKEAEKAAEKAAEKKAEEELAKAAAKRAEKAAERAAEKEAEKEARAEAAREARRQAEKEAEKSAEKAARAKAVAEAEKKLQKKADAAAEKALEKRTEAVSKELEKQEAEKEAEEAAKQQAEKEAEAQAKEKEREEAEKAAEEAKEEAAEKSQEEMKDQMKDAAKDQAKDFAKDQALDSAKDLGKEEAKNLAGVNSEEKEKKGALGTVGEEKKKGLEAALGLPVDFEPEGGEGGEKPGSPEVPGSGESGDAGGEG